jgi:hypothetical protein
MEEERCEEARIVLEKLHPTGRIEEFLLVSIAFKAVENVIINLVARDGLRST